MTRRRFAWESWDWGLLTLLAVALAFRLPYLTERSLWYDESSSWQTAMFAFPEMMRSIRLNVHLPLYQDFPLKSYIDDRATVRLLQPEPGLFWGWHLIRPDDLIAPEQFEAELRRGVWLVGRQPTPVVHPAVVDATLLERYEFRYYHALHRRMFVHHYRTRDEAAQKERPTP